MIRRASARRASVRRAIIHRTFAGLGLAFVIATAGTLAADRSPGSIAFPESMLLRVQGGVTFATWPYNDHRFSQFVGVTQMPPGFRDELLSGAFKQPTALRFLPDGSLLIAEQRGAVAHYRIGERGPDLYSVDAREDVFNQHQVGLLGLGVDPDFANEPYVYLLYTRDARLGGESPTYSIGADDDPCPDNGLCPASARLVRYRVDPATYRATGPAQVLVDDWCNQANNHTIGNIAFEPRTGALLAGGGDGADGSDPDWGQFGAPANACGDPPAAAGSPIAPPTTEGGSLRSQDLRLGDDPVGLAGTIIRVDRRTGEGMPDNPLASSDDANARRIVAYGLRNPYRFTYRPGTNDLWIGDVGYNSYEEIDLLPATPAAAMPATAMPATATPAAAPPNYGWPCFEGPYWQTAWSTLATDACESLYAAESSVRFPQISFPHDVRRNQRGCNAPGAAITTMTFYDGQMFPAAYRGALFFTDLPRACLFMIQPDETGVPDARTTRMFAKRLRAVDMVVGPDGALYYVDVYSNSLRRIVFDG